MSTEATIKIQFNQPIAGKISPIETIQVLLQGGWTFNDCGASSYFPLGEKEGFEWIIQEKISTNALMEILKKKLEQNEPLGVVMTWQGSSIGGPFLFYPNDPLTILLSMDRKIFLGASELEITDVNWYLDRLLPIFKQGGLVVEFYSYQESI